MIHYHLPHSHDQNTGHVLDKMPDVAHFQKVSGLFDKLGDATRLRIFWLLCHCEECVSNIAAAMEMSDPAVSHHLRLLRDAGLIVSRREGKEVYYRIAKSEAAAVLHRALDEVFEISCPSE